MKILLVVLVIQSLNLPVFIWFNRWAVIRILALRQQLVVYRRKPKKPRPDVLVLDFESLERMEIRADYSKTRNGHPLEAEEISGVLAEKISRQSGQTHYSQ